jgi:hypothetical protein
MTERHRIGMFQKAMQYIAFMKVTERHRMAVCRTPSPPPQAMGLRGSVISEIDIPNAPLDRRAPDRATLDQLKAGAVMA